MRRPPLAGAAVLLAVVGWAAPASAHVTVDPSALPRGTTDAVLTFRVPNESTTAAVVGLRIQFPLAPPIAVVNPQAGSGWEVTTRRATLSPSVSTDDGTFTSTVSEIDWTGGSIPVGQYGSFQVLAQGLPSGASSLAFPTVQLYSDGTSVAWIELANKAVPNPEHPAPVLELTAGTTTSATSAAVAAAPTVTAGRSTGHSSNALAVAALILAGFGSVVALLAVWLGRPLRKDPAD